MFEDGALELQTLVVMLLTGLDIHNWAQRSSSVFDEAGPMGLDSLEELADSCDRVMLRDNGQMDVHFAGIPDMNRFMREQLLSKFARDDWDLYAKRSTEGNGRISLSMRFVQMTLNFYLSTFKSVLYPPPQTSKPSPLSLFVLVCQLPCHQCFPCAKALLSHVYVWIGTSCLESQGVPAIRYCYGYE